MSTVQRLLPVVKLGSTSLVKLASPVVRLDCTVEREQNLAPFDGRGELRPLRRAHATLSVKHVKESAGLITGIASTPSADIVGDIVEPSGVVFKLPLPFLFSHDIARPLGHVIAVEASDGGIEITAKIATHVDVPFIRDAWALIKAGLIRGLSIGFRGLEAERIRGSVAGRRFTRWQLLEVSAVTLPANLDAHIVSVRACDRLGRY